MVDMQSLIIMPSELSCIKPVTLTPTVWVMCWNVMSVVGYFDHILTRKVLPAALPHCKSKHC